MSECNEKDGFVKDNSQLAACTLYNLENFARMVPAFKEHPFYLLTHSQMKALTDRLMEEP